MQNRNEPFTVFVEDVGDWSVGIRPIITLKADIDENMVEHLKDSKTVREFEKKLEELVKEFFEPETRYSTYDTDDLLAEQEYYKKMEEDGYGAY